MMKKFLTSQEAADYLGISEVELRSIIDRNKIPSYKIGGVYTRFKVDDLNHFRRWIPGSGKVKKSYYFYDRIRDFFYFNDFYIYSSVAIIVILYFIFKKQ